ncbi:hypothetical protein TAMA11512_09940 [Selenomonas sp. TAMA-11512]|nr:hypothetical protein TAMA11512_09940 [Selenomonas sp. TAMA-11512]
MKLVPVKSLGETPGRRKNAQIYEPESLLAIRFIDGLTRDGEMDAVISDAFVSV